MKKKEMLIGILSGNNNNDVERYKKACEDLGVKYEVIDIFTPDWIQRIKNSKADTFVVRPEVYVSVDKQLYDEKIYFIEKHLKRVVYPKFNELYIYENKRNMAYWLESYNIKHPKTSVFSLLTKNKYKIEEFLKSSNYPIVFKTYLGSSAAGVEILKNEKSALKLMKRILKKGYTRKPGNKKDVQWRYIIFQEFIPDAKEWRMIKLGESYFGHQKLLKNEFHSGSGEVGWIDPPKELLNLAKHICDLGDFDSMAIDIFEAKDGTYYVNELQTLFGSYLDYQMKVNDIPGRYIFKDKWIFEEGEFNQNASNNLRIDSIISTLLNKEKH